MKRKTLLFSLILVMACLSLALLGSDTPDGNLTMDEDDFVELVVDAPLSLNYLESVYSLKAVNQIVGNEGEDGFAEVLYNANDEAEYVLATAEEGGYAIFHRMTGALMEAGEFDASLSCLSALLGVLYPRILIFKYRKQLVWSILSY